MHIDHIAVWVEDLEKEKEFYQKYFGGKSGELYHNPKKDYKHYFLSFDNGNTRLELMTQPGHDDIESRHLLKGLAHLCFSVGDKDSVLCLTETLRSDGFEIISEPRTTGDGAFESAVLDPEGNYIELCAAK